MKKRLKEIEEEASALREMQAKVEKEMGAVQGFILIMLFICEFIFVDWFRSVYHLVKLLFLKVFFLIFDF